ncbi:metallophosphoesterase [Phyllobacterium sp. 0TCS1.6C]|uniref:metallophosphoesterase n=1 Tax=unclassified Phyllobacterium TaxID=2638441 RepID=UPI002264AC79|nr:MULTISPECIES: metallophosphoesterase [unclassified Phyllobacterium]MCX8281773.1 metallophosphoesterase [Phyllobacterium sp. 0TCS1.6C]MCX8295308.1 metallophosphoesterase [Phyllobacterium sp. 0TCS1.6A]
MKLWIMSDLHQEFARLAWRPQRVPEHDVLVLAGDIDVTCEKAIFYARSITDKPVVMVAGNHEFYGHNLTEQLNHAQHIAAKTGNVSYLENSTAIIGDARFIGATLWTDFELFSDLMSWQCQTEALRYMNDFKVIAIEADEIDLEQPRHGSDDKIHFTPRHAGNLHDASVAYIRAEIAKPFTGATVVLTHHAPHQKSIPEYLRHDLLSSCFASDLSELIEKQQPDLWVHGHIHHQFDYRVARTRIVANPRGYPNEMKGFNEELVVEV